MAFLTALPAGRRAGFAALTAVALAACADTGTITNTVVHPTLVEVWPSEFLGGVPCLDAPGAMRSYVATVWDTGPAYNPAGVPMPPDPATYPPFALPSSGPVACTQPVGFARIVPGHRYVADVDGYDRSDLEPLAPGSRIMIDPATGERVSPRWTTNCGGLQGTIARVQMARTIRDCAPLVDAAPSELTAVEVRIDAALGSLTCGEGPGQVSRFEVQAGTAESLEAPCGEAVKVTDVTAGTNLHLPVLAFEAENTEPSWGTTCTASVAAGAIVPASCTTLTDRGGVDVSPTEVLAAYGLDCGALGELFLENRFDPNDVRIVDSSSCASNVRFGGIPRGPAEVGALLVDVSGIDLGAALCSAEVVPNQAVPAACALEP
jgi:hypothetical protein